MGIAANLVVWPSPSEQIIVSCTKGGLHGPSMLAGKAKIYGVLYKQYSSIAFDETSSYWSALKSS